MSNEDIIDISHAANHTFVKTSNNEICAFGNNNAFLLGINIKDDKQEECQLTPIRVFEGNEDIWSSNINRSKPKSARSILPRPNKDVL